MSEAAGRLLGGRIVHEQAADGHRTGIEPVILAAALPVRPGERVLEAGAGSGAGLLCLAARVPGVTGVGIERDARAAEIARRNFAANGFSGLSVVETDIAAFDTAEPFDHAFANPPWHDARGTPSSDERREAARRADDGLFARWVGVLAENLRPRGTLSVILAASSLPACLAAFAASGCGGIAIFPLWPRLGRPAKLVIARAARDGRGPCRMLAGMTLHGDGQGFSAAAENVLRDGGALKF